MSISAIGFFSTTTIISLLAFIFSIWNLKRYKNYHEENIEGNWKKLDEQLSPPKD